MRETEKRIGSILGEESESGLNMSKSLKKQTQIGILTF